MRKILVAAVTVAAFGAVACADSMTTEPNALLDHQTGDPANAVFDLSDPILSGDASGGDVQLSWTSEDNYLDPNFHDAMEGWVHELDQWKFEIYRQSEGEDEFTKIFDDWYDEWEGESPACEWNDAQLECGFTDVEPGEGSHAYYVKAVAREGTTRGGADNFTMHHSHHSNEVEVTVGGSLRFEVIPVVAGNERADNYEDLNRNSGTWDLRFLVSIHDGESFEEVTSCSDLSLEDITVAANWENPNDAEWTGQAAECEYVDAGGRIGAAVYKVSVANQNQQENSDGSFEFTINGVNQENDVAFSARQPGR